jgi:Ulp1 family protease
VSPPLPPKCQLHSQLHLPLAHYASLLLSDCLQDLPHQRLCKNIPVQDNHCDCGLFVLTYLEYLANASMS